MTNCIIVSVEFYSRNTFSLTCVHGNKMQNCLIYSTWCFLYLTCMWWLLVTGGLESVVVTYLWRDLFLSKWVIHDGRGHSCPYNVLLWVSSCASEISKSFSCLSSYLPRGCSVPGTSRNHENPTKRFSSKKNKDVIGTLIPKHIYCERFFLFTNSSAVTVTGGKSDCRLTAASESFMNIPPHCYITGWCRTSWCVTVAIINLTSFWGEGAKLLGWKAWWQNVLLQKCTCSLWMFSDMEVILR